MPPWVGKEESLSPVPVEEEESDEDDWKAPMHYKPRKVSNWLYEIMAAAPFCSTLASARFAPASSSFFAAASASIAMPCSAPEDEGCC